MQRIRHLNLKPLQPKKKIILGRRQGSDPLGRIPFVKQKKILGVIGINGSQTGMLPGIPESAICVQKFDDSLNSAIHTTYRNSLRSSSLREPRDPLSKVVFKDL